MMTEQRLAEWRKELDALADKLYQREDKTESEEKMLIEIFAKLDAIRIIRRG